MITFRKAGKEDIILIRELSLKVWPQTYAAILTTDQMDYMLEMMYSPSSLNEQIMQKQHTFIIAYHNEAAVGFASYSLTNASASSHYRLHKIYVLPVMQGSGLGKKMIEYIISNITPLGATSLELNVNRHNKAKSFYEKLGFSIIKEEDINIGNGYFMNDFVMKKIL
ncbi:MAG: GNAT family N-acetyltransferase [Agriterribacter sp.]